MLRVELKFRFQCEDSENSAGLPVIQEGWNSRMNRKKKRSAPLLASQGSFDFVGHSQDSSYWVFIDFSFLVGLLVFVTWISDGQSDF